MVRCASRDQAKHPRLSSQLRVRFTTRFVTTRSTTAKKLDEKEIEHDDAITSLLLVSKSFLTYAEIKTALLHGATITLNETRKLYEIEKCFKRTGLALIKELYVTKEYNDWRHSSADTLPSAAALKKLTSLQRLIFHLTISPPLRFFDTNISLNNLVRIVGGHHDTSLTVYRDDARMLLAWLLNYIGDRMQKHIVNWLLVGTSNAVERVVKWQVRLQTMLQASRRSGDPR